MLIWYNKYELCHMAFYGMQGKLNKHGYCKNGLFYDSKTDRLLNPEVCPDWNCKRCKSLKHRSPRKSKERPKLVRLW